MATRMHDERVRAAEAAMAERLRQAPEIAERTARFLGAEPAAADLEALMADDSERFDYNLGLKVPRSVLQRAEALRPKVAQDKAYRATGRVSRSAVIRMALLKGLEALEAEYGGDGAP